MSARGRRVLIKEVASASCARAAEGRVSRCPRGKDEGAHQLLLREFMKPHRRTPSHHLLPPQPLSTQETEPPPPQLPLEHPRPFLLQHRQPHPHAHLLLLLNPRHEVPMRGSPHPRKRRGIRSIVEAEGSLPTGAEAGA